MFNRVNREGEVSEAFVSSIMRRKGGASVDSQMRFADRTNRI